MAIDDRLALGGAADDGGPAERAMRIERDDARLGRISPPRVESQGHVPVVEVDALEATLDDLADRGLTSVRGIDELAQLLDEDAAAVGAKRSGQEGSVAS